MILQWRPLDHAPVAPSGPRPSGALWTTPQWRPTLLDVAVSETHLRQRSSFHVAAAAPSLQRRPCEDGSAASVPTRTALQPQSLRGRLCSLSPYQDGAAASVSARTALQPQSLRGRRCSLSPYQDGAAASVFVRTALQPQSLPGRCCSLSSLCSVCINCELRRDQCNDPHDNRCGARAVNLQIRKNPLLLRVHLHP